ncbi:hypothetical protein Gotur_017667, partial [Gossypium turneri]
MRFVLLHQELSFLKDLLLFQYFCEDIEPPLKGEKLSIPCKLVLNVVGIEETEALAVLKSTVCVSGFDSSSKFKLLKAVLVFPISKEYLRGILYGLVSHGSWCHRVCSTLKFPLIRKVYLMPLYCSWDCGMRS